MKIFKSFLVLVALLTGWSSLRAQDIVAVASQDKDLSTLVTAITKADLAETLQGAGPFTVFAPKNSGFNDLHKIRMNTLMQAGMEKHLAELLSSHVVEGRYTEADLRKLIEDGGGKAQLTSVAGYPLTIEIDGSKVQIIDHLGEKSEVERSDVQASNGIVHVVDEVIIPREMEKGARSAGYMEEMTSRGGQPATQNQANQAQTDRQPTTTNQANPAQTDQRQTVPNQTAAPVQRPANDRPDMQRNQNAADAAVSTDMAGREVKDLVEMVKSLSNTTIAAQAIEAAGLTEELKRGGDDAWTLLVPSDEAFATISEDQRNSLMQNQEQLRQLLLNHAVDDREKFVELMDKVDWKSGDNGKFKTEAGHTLTLNMQDGKLVLTDEQGNKANIQQMNIPASNGVIYIIDSVLMPTDKGTMPAGNNQPNRNQNNNLDQDRSMKQDQPMDQTQDTGKAKKNKKNKNKTKNRTQSGSMDTGTGTNNQ